MDNIFQKQFMPLFFKYLYISSWDTISQILLNVEWTIRKNQVDGLFSFYIELYKFTHVLTCKK